MAYQRKTRDLWAVECDYGYGWETVTIDDNIQDAKQMLQDYIANEVFFGIAKRARLKKRREKI